MKGRGVPKLWCVKLIQKLSGNPRPLQALARELGLKEIYQPIVVPNTPSNNETLSKIGSLVHFQPLVIAPNSYPYADHPYLAPNGVFYPSEDKLVEIHHKYGNTSKFIDFPRNIPNVVKRDILSKYEKIFGTS